ncbi:GNAT family N-acetyltransferase [Asanoa sp. WMMD1127]|uniref:GNAT family N-acetyltransferase n=1 Tax=Asanoa sp. WMMD1127 TaxID=3016107 RepID=UPI002416322D|nr:GNAT family N-acetyltransferase [Asanoa sp. WMMD1127]MDG4823372.1 GNAT family N-acetyltransferase [Asanoa sp. WMMD1127]
MSGPAYAEELPGFGAFRLDRVDPTADLDLIHGWVTEPRARFWGMTTYSPAEVHEVYAFLDGLPTHHAYLMRLNGEPIGIFQTYEPAEDPIGAHYPVREGDFGIHLFLAPADPPRPGFTGAVAAALLRFAFAHPGVQRIVVEPDVRNERALIRWQRLGFEFGDQVTTDDKTAQLAFYRR